MGDGIVGWLDEWMKWIEAGIEAGFQNIYDPSLEYHGPRLRHDQASSEKKYKRREPVRLLELSFSCFEHGMMKGIDRN